MNCRGKTLFLDHWLNLLIYFSTYKPFFYYLFVDLDAFNNDKFQQLKLYVGEQISSSNCKKCLGEENWTVSYNFGSNMVKENIQTSLMYKKCQ